MHSLSFVPGSVPAIAHGAGSTRRTRMLALLAAAVGVASFSLRETVAVQAAPPPAPLGAWAMARLAPDARTALDQPDTCGLVVQMEGPLTPPAIVRVWCAGARVLDRDRDRSLLRVSAPGTALPRLARLPGVARIRLEP